MTTYHAVMIDETGCEFGVDIDAESRDEAYDRLEEDYPESNVAQLESPRDTTRRESDMYRHIERGGDWDDEGRPFFPHGYDEEYYDHDD